MSEEDQDFDLCECVFSHEFAMRRLLNLLRNGQSACTDTECTDLVSPQNASPSGDSADNFTWMMFMMIAAVILYLIRPNSLRRRQGDDFSKAPRDDRPPHDPQPPMAN